MYVYICDVCKLLRHINDISMIFILQLADRTLATRIRIQPWLRTTSRVKYSLTFVYSIEINGGGVVREEGQTGSCKGRGMGKL
jgi:hypothetical protein